MLKEGERKNKSLKKLKNRVLTYTYKHSPILEGLTKKYSRYSMGTAMEFMLCAGRTDAARTSTQAAQKELAFATTRVA
jgi:hypothetical protein